MGKAKTVDLRPEKVSDEDLQHLQGVVSAMNKLQFDIGMLEVQKHNALHAMSQAAQEMSDVRDSFKEAYGTEDVNVADGVINYSTDD